MNTVQIDRAAIVAQAQQLRARALAAAPPAPVPDDPNAPPPPSASYQEWLGITSKLAPMVTAALRERYCPAWEADAQALQLFSEGLAELGAKFADRYIPVTPEDVAKLGPTGKLVAGAALLALANFDMEAMAFKPRFPVEQPKPPATTAAQPKEGQSDGQRDAGDGSN